MEESSDDDDLLSKIQSLNVTVVTRSSRSQQSVPAQLIPTPTKDDVILHHATALATTRGTGSDVHPSPYAHEALRQEIARAGYALLFDRAFDSVMYQEVEFSTGGVNMYIVHFLDTILAHGESLTTLLQTIDGSLMNNLDSQRVDAFIRFHYTAHSLHNLVSEISATAAGRSESEVVPNPGDWTTPVSFTLFTEALSRRQTNTTIHTDEAILSHAISRGVECLTQKDVEDALAIHQAPQPSANLEPVTPESSPLEPVPPESSHLNPAAHSETVSRNPDQHSNMALITGHADTIKALNCVVLDSGCQEHLSPDTVVHNAAQTVTVAGYTGADPQQTTGYGQLNVPVKTTHGSQTLQLDAQHINIPYSLVS